MQQYLLPCSCGRKLKVDTSQAGLRIPCQCGQSQEVPTLRGLRGLEAVDTGPAVAPENPWGPRQGVIFLGVVISLCGLAMTAILWYQRPPYFQPEVNLSALHKSTQEMTLEQTHHAWLDIQSKGLDKTPSQHLAQWSDQISRNNRWLVVGSMAGATGIVMIVSALLSGPKRGRKRAG